MKCLTRLCLALCLLGGALITTATPAQSREIIVRQSDRGRPVELLFGDTLSVQLAEPPGSQWRLQNNDPAVLRFAGPGRVVERRSWMEREFNLRGVGRGSVTLSFSLMRVIRGRTVVEDTFRVPVTVRGRDVGPGPWPGGGSESLVITDSANGTQVRFSRGDTVVVQLRTPVIKGYHWVRTKNDASVLRPLGDGRIIQGRRGQWVTEFRFQAVGSGRSWVAFNFRNPRVRGRDPLTRDFSFVADVPRWGNRPR
jgi:predicted secreted protein